MVQEGEKGWRGWVFGLGIMVLWFALSGYLFRLTQEFGLAPRWLMMVLSALVSFTFALFIGIALLGLLQWIRSKLKA